MEWEDAENKDNGLTKIPKRWLNLRFYEAFNILFRYENALRVLVYVVLKNAFLDDWGNCNFSIGEGRQQSIKGAAAKRISQAEALGYLGFDIRAPLMHLTSGELIELITSQAYWPKFAHYFRGTKETIKYKLLEIGSIRNSLAHFRPIKADDIETIKQNSRHTLPGVEKCLQSVFNQPLRVPTNTSDDWYRELSTLAAAHVSTVVFCSADDRWINVRLVFETPIFAKEKFGDGSDWYTLPKLNSRNILLLFSELRKLVTYLSESLAYPRLLSNCELAISKHLNFVFGKPVLVREYRTIAEQFNRVLRLIAEECELTRQDNFAKGGIIETTHVSARRPKEDSGQAEWVFNIAALSQPYESDHPDEYWGQSGYSGDAVTGLRRYPWMPEDVSGGG